MVAMYVASREGTGPAVSSPRRAASVYDIRPPLFVSVRSYIPENKPYKAENATVAPALRDGNHSPRVRIVQTAPAGMKQLNLVGVEYEHEQE